MASAATTAPTPSGGSGPRTAVRHALTILIAAGLMGSGVVASACAPDPPAAAAAVAVTTTCRSVTEFGAGMLIDNGLVLTSAHVVAAAEDITVHIDGRDIAADVVAFDPDNDLAYLEPITPLQHGWSLATLAKIGSVERGSPASVYVVRDGEMTRLDATVVRRLEIDTEDIYIDADVTRPGWEVHYPIEPGDSGGAVVVDGVVIGVVWAKSRAAGDRAYAIDPVRGGDLLGDQLATATMNNRDGAPIDFGRC